ncbi:Loki-CTERM sorting domain-containing protein [Bacteroides caccae]
MPAPIIIRIIISIVAIFLYKKKKEARSYNSLCASVYS